MNTTLCLNLEGILFKLKIRRYRELSGNVKDWALSDSDKWCKTDFSFSSGTWLNYHREDDEVFLFSEICDLTTCLADFLDGKLTKDDEFTFIEPDFTIKLYPPCEQQGSHIEGQADIQVSFWDESLTNNYLSVTMGEKDIAALLLYLKLVRGIADEEDESVRQMTEAGIFVSE